MLGNEQKKQISSLLVTLAAADLTEDDKERLNQIIARLFADLDQGHSCTLLDKVIAGADPKQQLQLLISSKLAYEYSELPTRIEPLPLAILTSTNKQLVYITKYLQYELDVVFQLKRLCTNKATTTVDSQHIKLLEQISEGVKIPNFEQLQAIKNALQYKVSIISGGPGTGKTTTVALLLWLLYQTYGSRQLRVKVCAPTGRASKRVSESIKHVLANSLLSQLDFGCFSELLSEDNNFLTIHKLLGYQANNIYFKHNQSNLLDLDVLVVDESSMISLPLFSKLLQAIDTNKVKHLILLGDKNQLSSVEEGYVFASMITARSLKLNTTHLFTGNRSSKDIGKLASLVQEENVEEFNRLLKVAPAIKNYKAKLSILFERQLFAEATDSLTGYFKFLRQTDLENIPQLFAKFNQQVVLCLTNVGLFGTVNLNTHIERQVKFLIARLQIHQREDYDLFSMPSGRQMVNFTGLIGNWYSGRPIIILENDYSLGLFNGDIGICLIIGNKAQVVFENGRRFAPEVLPTYQVAYAITIHKSQGSEYEHVNLVLGDNHVVESMPELLSKELIYTAITRAKNSLSIFAGDKVLPYAINNLTLRNTGLDIML